MRQAGRDLWAALSRAGLSLPQFNVLTLDQCWNLLHQRRALLAGRA